MSMLSLRIPENKEPAAILEQTNDEAREQDGNQ